MYDKGFWGRLPRPQKPSGAAPMPARAPGADKAINGPDPCWGEESELPIAVRIFFLEVVMTSRTLPHEGSSESMLNRLMSSTQG